MAVEDCDKRVIFSTEDGGVGYLIPTRECLEKYSIEEIARKDVPAGRPYKIVHGSELPTDSIWRSAWTIDEAELTDGEGAESNEFEEIR